MSKINHHPDTATLIEFSAGVLPPAVAICVSAHLHYCEKCRSELVRLDQIASQLMSSSGCSEVSADLLAKIEKSIDQLPTEASNEQLDTSVDSRIPHLVAKLMQKKRMADLDWKKMSSAVEKATLTTGQSDYEVALHKICAGGKTPKHGHGGKEYTVVLKGSFSDEMSVYTEGDFLLREGGDEHQPTGAQNGECICLSALEAPIKLSNPFGFLMKPWLRINPV
jgi:putative transcriptional regulator